MAVRASGLDRKVSTSCHLVRLVQAIPAARCAIAFMPFRHVTLTFHLPGWRFGWVALHDPLNVAGAVRNGLHAWGNRIMGPNTLVQKSLKRILSETPDSWYDEVTRKLEVSTAIERS